MAIVMMTNRARYEEFLAGKLPADVTVAEVADYSGHEKGRVSHQYDCPQNKAFLADEKLRDADGWQRHYFTPCAHCQYSVMDSLYMETSHVGLVVELRERNGYHDSDFYARVWDPKTKSIFTIEYATTRGWTYPNYATSADATPEVMAEYHAWERACDKARWERQQAADKAAAEAKRQAIAALQDKLDATPSRGALVEVVNNRSKKAKKGERGEVTWKGVSKFDDNKIVVGVKLGDRVVYLNADAVAPVAALVKA